MIYLLSDSHHHARERTFSERSTASSVGDGHRTFLQGKGCKFHFQLIQRSFMQTVWVINR